MKPINLDYLEKIQKYCDSRAYQREFGYDEKECSFDESTMGRIGQQLACISASIEEIFEIYNSTLIG